MDAVNNAFKCPYELAVAYEELPKYIYDGVLCLRLTPDGSYPIPRFLNS
jgi:hypothetical protein